MVGQIKILDLINPFTFTSRILNANLVKICYNKNVGIEIPKFVKACLWSYDIDKIDFSVPDHRKGIIQNILNRGTSDAISWLREIFSEREIAEVIEKSASSDWNKKSLALWSLVFNVHPLKEGRFT